MAQEQQPKEGRNVRQQLENAAGTAVMDVVTRLLSPDLRGDNNRQHANQIPEDRQGKGRDNQHGPLPPSGKAKHSVNKRHRQRSNQAAHSAASRRNLILVLAARVGSVGGSEQLCAYPL